jgi:DUF3048 family protein
MSRPQARLRSRLLPACALLAAGTLAVAACGGGSNKGEKPTPKKATTTTAAAPIAPLSGAPDPTGAARGRPALTVKVENTTDALPQAGIDQADVVYEEVVEAGITRLAAMFNSHAPDKIGPVRSVRNTDQAIVWPVGGIFVYSGGAPVSIASISTAPVERIDESRAGDAMFRVSDRRRPHNLFADAPKLFAKGGQPVPPPPLFTYRGGGAVAAGTPANVFTVGFRQNNAVTWKWDPVAGHYVRNVFGADQRTEAGQPIAPQNVIVQFVNYVGGKNNAGAGAEGSEAVMVGHGDAWIFSMGKVVHGRWQRDSKQQATRFLDATGKDIALTPGQTWVELPQIGYALDMTG